MWPGPKGQEYRNRPRPQSQISTRPGPNGRKYSERVTGVDYIEFVVAKDRVRNAFPTRPFVSLPV